MKYFSFAIYCLHMVVPFTMVILISLSLPRLMILW